MIAAELPPADLIQGLEKARPRLESLTAEALATAWIAAVDQFLEATPGSAEDRLREQMAVSCQFSRPGLDAGLEVVLRGVRSAAAVEIFDHARKLQAGAGPALAIVASNLPGLAVQSLLPALALRRPLLIKSPSAEPLFAPAFLDALSARLPAIAGAYAARSWVGGSREIERPLLAEAGRVIAYGSGPTIEDLERRAGAKLRAHGPKISVAVIGAQAVEMQLEQVADGLARDIALFDQRGCLSVQAVITDGDAEQLAHALVRALTRCSLLWPMAHDAAAASAARQARDESIMRGSTIAPLSISAGTICIEPSAPIRLSPGRRFIRLYPVESLRHGLELLEPWRGLLQGAAVAEAESATDALLNLGISRLARPGELQDVDVATWHNGGLAPLDAFL